MVIFGPGSATKLGILGDCPYLLGTGDRRYRFALESSYSREMASKKFETAAGLRAARTQTPGSWLVVLLDRARLFGQKTMQRHAACARIYDLRIASICVLTWISGEILQRIAWQRSAVQRSIYREGQA